MEETRKENVSILAPVTLDLSQVQHHTVRTFPEAFQKRSFKTRECSKREIILQLYHRHGLYQ